MLLGITRNMTQSSPPLLFLLCFYITFSALSDSNTYFSPFLYSHSAPLSSLLAGLPSWTTYILSLNSKQVIHDNTFGFFGDIYLLDMPGRTGELDACRLLRFVISVSYTMGTGADESKVERVPNHGAIEGVLRLIRKFIVLLVICKT